MRKNWQFLIYTVAGAIAAGCTVPQATMRNAPQSYLNQSEEFRPVYPAALRGTGVSGLVVAHVIVEASGEVREVRIIKSPHELLSAEVVAKLKKWKYKPYPQGFIAEYEFNFNG